MPSNLHFKNAQQRKSTKLRKSQRNLQFIAGAKIKKETDRCSNEAINH
jgi:hypothetical protein